MARRDVIIEPLTQAEIELRLQNCARLPSLGSIDKVLRELLNAEECYTSQIVDVIRRDPSMTTRLLRMVNSVYFGLALPVTSIEEAVFYLGVRQVRQLAMVTPVIEDLQKFSGKARFPWHSFWQHCLATAILMPDILAEPYPAPGEIDYVSGLLHDVGKIVMAAVFPEHFTQVHTAAPYEADLLELERSVLGMDHCELGAIYLRNYSLPEPAVHVARYHHNPEAAQEYKRYVAAAHIADITARYAGIGASGNCAPVTEEDWKGAAGWNILYPEEAPHEKPLATANLKRSLERLPAIIEGMM